MARIKNQGAANENLCVSYENGAPPSEIFMVKEDISQEAIANASYSESISYSFLYSFDIDTLASAIRDNKGAILLVRGTNNNSWLSTMPNPPTMSTPHELLWGHWIAATGAKMVDGKKYIIFRNSWGEAVGDRGNQYLSQEYINSGFVELAMLMSFGAPKAYRFERDLYYGVTSADVYFLQKILNRNPITQVATTGVGSPGKESYFYGNLTKAAVIRFQLSQGIIPPIGYTGSRTRAVLNELSF
jgi:hypothetical protein